jgi:spore coat polysaccharide biosynthesis protein SpsF
MSTTKYKTEQEAFWAGSFGDAYIDRNKSEQLLASNLQFFSKALKQAGKWSSCIEFGANIGMNLKALKLLFPGIQLKGIEINAAAAQALAEVIGPEHVYNGSIFDVEIENACDLAFIKGVLIHINPEELPTVYDKLYAASNKYILVAEYYNPSPVKIPYRGHNDRLFKRDFAGELMDRYPDLTLLDYGFAYRRDPAFPQDEITWFLMQKNT